MGLNFSPPPDWLIQEYINRKQPAEIASEGIGNALENYAKYSQLDKANKLKQNDNDRATKELSLKTSEFEANFGYDPNNPGPAFDAFKMKYPQGIKGRERQQSSRPQQASFLINGKAAVFNPETSQYEIAEVVDPRAASTPGPVQDPTFTPRTEPTPSAQFVGVQDGKPVLFNPKTSKMTTGTLPGSGPLTSTTQTEGQANAKLYATRMEEADKQLNSLSKNADLASGSSGVQGRLPNILKSNNIQVFEQSKRNFLNAVLRRESGAVISPTEFAEGNKQYFVVMGDSPDVIKQKAMNRKTAIEGLRNAAGMPSSGKTRLEELRAKRDA